MWSRSAALVTLSASATAMNALMCRKSMAAGFYTKSVCLTLKDVLDSCPAAERAYPPSESRFAASRRVTHAWFEAGSARTGVRREHTDRGIRPGDLVGRSQGHLGWGAARCHGRGLEPGPDREGTHRGDR